MAAVMEVVDNGNSSHHWLKWQSMALVAIASLKHHQHQWRDGGSVINRCCTVDNDNRHCQHHHRQMTPLPQIPFCHCPSILPPTPSTMTAINKDYHCHGRHRLPLPSTMTAIVAINNKQWLLASGGHCRWMCGSGNGGCWWWQ
jgi:hypothetical protein